MLSKNIFAQSEKWAPKMPNDDSAPIVDPHAGKKAASLSSVDECDAWIRSCRARADEGKAQMAVARISLGQGAE